jgi:xylan 1,4-beta-xylosidase
MRRLILPLICIATITAGASAAEQASIPVTIHVDASHTLGPWKPAWRFFGYDEADYTFMPAGQRLLSEIGQIDQAQIYIRCHHLLTSGNGVPALKWSSTNAYSEDDSGKPVYDWSITDKIFDSYIQRGLKPYVQIGFMPKALSIRPDIYPSPTDPTQRVPVDAGQAYPPKDYDKWRNLAFEWVNHCIQRYGKGEVEQWYWEIWNEPNIFYWKATPEEYYKLYDYAVDGVRRALPTARVGGPEQAGGGGKFLHDFLQHCIDGRNESTGKAGSPIDFISFHAKGSPRFVQGHVRMGLANQLNNIESGFATVAEFPRFKNTPIVIGESDPDGCAACTGPQLGYRNTPLYACYTAAALARTFEIADKQQINFEGALTWAFEFEDDPPFSGHRVLSSGGIDLPVLNVFRMYSHLHGNRLAAESSDAVQLAAVEKSGVRAAPDVGTLAAMDDRQMAVILWNYHDDDVPGPVADIALTADHLPASKAATLTEYRIDQTHSNAHETWLHIGSPSHPRPEQLALLQKDAQLQKLREDPAVSIDGGIFKATLSLPRQGISLLILTFQ